MIGTRKMTVQICKAESRPMASWGHLHPHELGQDICRLDVICDQVCLQDPSAAIGFRGNSSPRETMPQQTEPFIVETKQS